MKRWYVVQVYTGFEEAVKDSLVNRIATEDCQDLFGDVLVPTGEASYFPTGEEEVEREKIFPGYVLVQMEMTGEAFQLVTSVPRVAKFLGGNNPVSLSDKEVERIHSQISGKLVVPTTQITFVTGAEINIGSGPFAGFVGIVDDVDEEHEKLTVMVSIFGRLTPVELAFNQVKR